MTFKSAVSVKYTLYLATMLINVRCTIIKK